MARVSTAMTVALLLFISVSGCGGADNGSRVLGGGSELFPADSLRDWVSYADHVAVYSVVDERALVPDPVDVEHGGGLQGREVTLRVDRVLWSADGAPPMPETIRMQALGWVLEEDGDRGEAAMADAPRVAVGDRYVAPLARVRAGTGELEWWPLSVGAQLPVSDGEIVAPSDARWSSVSLETLEGTSLARLESLVETSVPDPVAARFMHLRPQERVAEAAEARARAQGLPTEPPPR